MKIKIYKNFASQLIKRGKSILKKAFNIKLKATTSGSILSLFYQLDYKNLYFADQTYYYVDLSVMEDIIKYDWTDRRKYIKEINDCDNYSLAFKSHLWEIFGINTVAEARHIEMIDPETKKHLAWHRANVFVAKKDGVLKAFLLEPQTDKFTEMKKGGRYIFYKKEYVLKSFDF